MSDRATSHAALASVSAQLPSIRQMVRDCLMEHGAMPQFKVEQAFKDIGLDLKDRTIGARLNELAMEDPPIVGHMHFTVVDPNTKEEVCVWGLIKEHGARDARPDDKLMVRIKGKCYSVKFPRGTLADMTPDTVRSHAMKLIQGARP